MAKRIAVAGYGAVGHALAERLFPRGDDARILQSQALRPSYPRILKFVHADVEDAQEAPCDENVHRP